MKKKQWKKKTLLGMGTLVASFAFIPLSACNVSHTLKSNKSLSIFSPNPIQTAANGGFSFDSSYSAATLENTIGTTRAHLTDYSTDGSYSDYKSGSGYNVTPKSIQSDTGVATASSTTAIAGPKKTNNGFYETKINLKSGFGYVSKDGLAVAGNMPDKDHPDSGSWISSNKVEVTKWDYLLGLARFWYASNNFLQGDGVTHVLAQNAYYVSMLGLDIDQTIAYNVLNPDPYEFYVITNHYSPAYAIINKEFFSAPVSPGYIQTLLSNNSQFKNQSIQQIATDGYGDASAFKNFIASNLNSTQGNYDSQGDYSEIFAKNFKNYIGETTQVYGPDKANYSQSVMIFSGKYYISSYVKDVVAIFNKNPYYNAEGKTNGRYANNIGANDQLIGNDDHTFDKITEILSNQSAAADPTLKAYSQWIDGQVDVITQKQLNPQQTDDILNNYPQYVQYVGSQPTTQTNNIIWNLNIFDQDGNPKSNISANYEKYAKQFYTPAAIDLRYNLNRAVNYVDISRSMNPQNPASINLSSTPIKWESATDKWGENVDLPLVQDSHGLTWAGGNIVSNGDPTAPLDPKTSMPLDTLAGSDDGTPTSQKLVNNPQYSDWNWSQMQSAITSDLNILGLDRLDVDYMTLVQYTNVQYSAFQQYNAAWQAVSNGRVSLTSIPFSDERRLQIYNNKNCEIGSNFWSPDFSGGLGSWYRSFSGKAFIDPDIIYGLAKTGMFDADPDSTVIGNPNNAASSANKFGFKDMAQWIIDPNHWKVTDSNGHLITPPANTKDFQDLILAWSESNNQIDGKKWVDSENDISQIADLMSFWVNDAGTGSNSPTQKALRLSNWQNVASFGIPYPDQQGYTARNPMLLAKGVKYNTVQTQDSILDFADTYRST